MARVGLGAFAAAPGALLLAALFTGGTAAALMTMVAALWAAMLFLGFLALLFGNKRLDAMTRWSWAFAFLFAAPIALPWYWAVHVMDAPADRLRHA